MGARFVVAEGRREGPATRRTGPRVGGGARGGVDAKKTPVWELFSSPNISVRR